MRKNVLLYWACAATLSWAGTVTITQPGEILTAPRPSTTPTRLLFPLVTSIAGFDTEITISNTSQDTLGSVPQSGTCTLAFYGVTSGGATVPGPQTSLPIAAGKQLVFRLSQGGGGIAAAPNFEGYITATCSFPLARGAASLGPPGIWAVSQEAQVITVPRSTAQPQFLLFPFVTNQAGYDTALVISNTSMDSFGTTATIGACTLSFYGAGAPASVGTGIISPAREYAALLSQIAPGFQGYAIASCNFTGATGMAFPANGIVGLSESPEPLAGPRDTTVRPLLFSSVSNQNGLDTGIAIVNTSQDSLGTTPVSGACTLNFYGVNPPPPVSTGTIPAGGEYVTTASQIAPDFKGYVFANCTFPHARGWSFTVSGRTDGDGQSAEVVAQPRSGTPAALLFSGATNQNGADTTITISNTSQDPFGTAPSAGACLVSYFGDMSSGAPSPASQVSALIQPGGQLSFTLSAGNPAQGIAPTPGFRGYVIAACGFPLARGVATITSPLALRFVPVTPCRAADTRDSTGKAGFTGTRDFLIAGQACGIPAEAQAYSLNVSAIPRGPSLGFLAIWPGGQAQPVVSTLNSYDGRVKASAALVPAGANGAVSVYVSDAADVFLDINGYFVLSAPTAPVYYPVAPCRLADTRTETGKAGFSGLKTIPMTGVCGLPAGAQAYAVNFTVIPRTASFSFLSAWPTGQTQPAVSTLNAFNTGGALAPVTANAAIVPAGTGGSINVYNTDAADLLVDVSGYFAAPAAGGLLFHPVTPCRAADTRPDTAKAGFAGTRDFPLPTSGCSVPVANAYSLSATVLPRPQLDFLTLWATGAPQPAVSTLNSFDQSVVSNAAIVPANAAGSIAAYQTQAADLILDVNGYFAP